ncbi:MAG: ATP-dependent zinc protease [Hyphomicrobiales bacterium]|nr:ATP-dependent zinc protease [Hyphomicrobiales bacterium]
MARKQRKTMIIGWQEWIALPELGVSAVKAKVDTGAKTSSLHAYHIEEYTYNGAPHVRFEVHPVQRNQRITRVCEAKIIDYRKVKSSSGESEERPVIVTQLSLGDATWEIELNLTNRDYMGFRMLLGREALRQRLLIDAGSHFLHGRKTAKSVVQLYKG